jgi:hypothetical protein
MREGLGRVVSRDPGDRNPASQFTEKEFLQNVVTAQEAAEDRYARLGEHCVHVGF